MPYPAPAPIPDGRTLLEPLTAAMRAVQDVEAGRVDVDALPNAVAAISVRPPAPTWLFTLAAALAAAALAVIFGIQHLLPAALIFVSAAAGVLVGPTII